MHTNILAAAVLLATSAPAAFAADGTLTINGKITAQTCTISGNGGGKDFTVTLPTISNSALPAVGATAGRTPFNIALSACTPNSGNVLVYFEPGSNASSSTGNLHNTATGGAANVQVSLLNGDMTKINMNNGQATQNSKPVALTNGAATLNYYAQYVSTGAVTAGDVTAVSMYSVVYQ
ncbi:TPA: type 1 fimbrial protein [Pseudomonas aeruginosa]|nr:type 1 fimbrial protein [Pseudomonas aeruginosa]HEH8432042.1 type 1 fimbrial protein [Pseudomonas aeruginosa]HEH8533593.1 type 1 fimbrial protein [Pseudomonas aeruginosa]HEH8759620.1 type 1 fimbrial protein [Pseudomonas aeruginosa]